MPTSNEDIIDRLLAQHEQIKLLFGQLATATGATKQRLFESLVALLAVHESVEESLVHPLARMKLSDADAVVDGRLAEEQEAKQALAGLYDRGVEDPAFDGELSQLRDAVAAHALAEEQLEFAGLREVMDGDELRRMRSVMNAAEALVPTRPHPGVSSDALANLLLGPPLAVFDRVRDAIREAGDKG